MAEARLRRRLSQTVRVGAFILGAVLMAFVASASAQSSSQSPTFARDVAPILQEKCEACHREGSMAPMSLVDYRETRPWARRIKAVVESREMPPWHLDQRVGIKEFKNDRSLSDQQISTIVQWVDASAPMGDPADLPRPMTWPQGETWNFEELFGPPDLIIKSPAYTVPAQAQDAWYKPVVDTGVTEPRWVRAIEIRPSTPEGRRVTHHALARLQQDEPEYMIGNDPDEIGPGLFMEWAVGKQGEITRADSGKLMLPDSKIVWDIHYHAVGEEITNSVELAIYFHPKGYEPEHRQVLHIIHAIEGGPRGLDIRPNSISVHQGFFALKQAGRVENFQPHMHLRGKAMSMEAILPDGTRQMLSHVDSYQFDWHNNYVYADHVAPLLPKGALLRVTAWHDNTSANRDNPDPNQWVGWGDRTIDDMAHAWVNITYMSDEDLEAEIAKREANRLETTDRQP